MADIRFGFEIESLELGSKSWELSVGTKQLPKRRTFGPFNCPTFRFLLFSMLITKLLSAPSFAQKPLNLDSVLRIIEMNNPSLRSYDNLIKGQDAKIDGAGAQMAPMVGAGTFMTPYPGAEMVSDGDKGALMITAEQEIRNPAKSRANREYLKTLSKTYFYEKSMRFNELRASARRLYFDMLIANRKYYIQKENQQIVQNMKKLAEIRYPYNKSNLDQLLKAEGKVYESENMLLMTESEIRSKKIALNALMNRSAVTELQIDTIYKVDFKPIAVLDTGYFSETRSDVVHMQHDIHSMEARIRSMKQEAKPDLKLRFDHMANYSAMMPKQFTAMAMLSIPIAPWSSKMYKSEVKSMNFQKQAMQQQKEAMLIEMLGMARSMESEINSMQKQISNYENKILPTMKKALKASMLTYQENKGELNMVLDSWEAVNMSQMNYLGQLQKYYQMIADYEKIIER